MKNQLKELREKRGFTQRQVAENINKSIRQYQRYEFGEVEPPIQTALKLASILYVSIEQLYKQD